MAQQEDKVENKIVNVCASLKVKEEKLDEFLAACDPCIQATNKEKGCIFYNCHQDLSDPTHIMFIEQWESIEDLETHLKSQHVADIFAAYDKCKAAEANLMKFTGPKVVLKK